jgi:hypothetical protein
VELSSAILPRHRLQTESHRERTLVQNTAIQPHLADLIFTLRRILANAYGCAPFASGRAPNFVLLDFVNIGDGFKAANILNGLP